MPEPITVTLDAEQALDILEKLRVASIWLGPKPPDWKPEKWPEDLAEEFGLECNDEFQRLLDTISKQIGDY